MPEQPQKNTLQTEIEKLNQKVESLHSLLDISAIINSELDLNQLLEISMHLAKKVMQAEAASLMLFNEDKSELHFKIALGDVGAQLLNGVTVPLKNSIAGSVATSGRSVIIQDAQNDNRFHRETDKRTGFITKTVLCAPLKTRTDIIGVTQVLNRTTNKPFENEDLALFEAFSSQVATAIENARLHTSLLDKQRLEQELETAAIIQKGFLPQAFPENKKFDIAACHISAKQCSGDFYDIIEYENNQMGILIGDVAGKGVPAALHMAGFISDFRSLAPVKRDTAQLFNSLNQMLFKKMLQGKFITITYIMVDYSTYIVELLNAGHIPSIHINGKSGEMKRIDAKGGPPLGISNLIKYEYESTRFEEGDTFLMFTDGLTEAMSPGGEMYGYETLEEILKKNCHRPLSEIVDAIVADVRTFAGDGEPHDDLTLIAFKLKEL
ncbi:GAF domain-containing SpoIIE family protein phosphatase [Candidatus Riflebacteria bacterium]